MNNWKSLALALAQTGEISWREIAKTLDVPRSTVSDYLREAMAYAAPTEQDTFKSPAWHGKEDPSLHDNSRILFISDMHIPYHHKNTLAFLEGLKRKYKPTRVVSLGDECFPGDVCVLTKAGWIAFESLQEGVEVLQYNEDGSSEFVLPSRIVRKNYTGDMITRKNGNYYSRTTEGHDIVLRTPKGGLVKFPAKHENYTHYKVPRCTTIDGPGIPLSDDEIRLFVAISADFTLLAKGGARGSLTRQRKIDRMREILVRLNARYTETIHPSRPQATHFYVHGDQFEFLAKLYPHEWLSLANLHQRKVILEEMSYWDGHRDPHRNRHIFCSSLEQNIVFMQTLAHTAGVEASIRGVNSEFGYSLQASVLYGKQWTKNNCNIEKEFVDNLPVFCCTVPSGMILVRQNNCITVSGNCDKHNLSYHDSDPDLHTAGKELELAKKTVKQIEAIFPVMDIVHSNHGSLAWRKAKTHGISRHYIKPYNEVLGVGPGWRWHPDITLQLPDGQNVYVHHGKTADAVKVSQAMGMSFVCGHFHEKFGINYWANPLGLYFAMNCGCLVDDDSLAFSYNNVNLKRPIIGTGLIIDGKPILETMPL